MGKGILHIIISLLLLVTTTGVSISKHYCGDNLINVALFVEAESCCDDSDCCHNENEYFQFKDDFVGSFVVASIQIVELELLRTIIPITFVTKSLGLETTLSYISESPPPLLTSTKLSLLQTYLI